MTYDDDEEPTISEAIIQIARSIQEAQCMPPAGAHSPFELFVSIHLDEETTKTIRDLGYAMDGISNAIQDVADAIREAKE